MAENSRKILVVDDQAAIRLALSTALKNICNHEVYEARNGKEAVGLILEQTFDLILCDLNMPESDGLVLMQQMAEHKINSCLVVMSGEEEALLNAAKSLATSYKLPLIGVTNKPISADRLRQFVQQSTEFEHNGQANLLSELTAEELENCIKGQFITPFFQPQINLETKTLAGFEALARIRHPELGLLPPYMFIDLAERSNLMPALTLIIADQALFYFKKWQQQFPDITLSINLSAKILEEQNFPEVLAGFAAANQVPPENIICELTETIVSQNPNALLNNMIRLRLNKFKLSIDDFGTGYASMSQLKELPFHELKIDQCFITDYLDNIKSSSITNSSLDIAKALNLKTVAEGVENVEVFNKLTSIGCDIAQGYYISKPLAAKQIDEFINTRLPLFS